jgi:4-hydroxyphenylacetate 3-monooxygenase
VDGRNKSGHDGSWVTVGSRHAQYEKFYCGASFLVKQNVFRNFDFKPATGLVEREVGGA